MDSGTAQKTFELNNNIQTVDSIYAYDAADQKAVLNGRPWKADPHYFKYVKISAVALVKMVTHARSGGQYEIMGLMQGKIENETFIVMDAFALPVLGTETRVNAGSEGDEYMVQYQDICKKASPHLALERSKTDAYFALSDGRLDVLRM
jgi:COP9 signalosome complex subunit 5